jgi:beta-glucosidase
MPLEEEVAVLPAGGVVRPAKVQALLDEMTVEEKVGQLTLVNGSGGWVNEDLAWAVRSGNAGAVLNEVSVDAVNELQRLAVEESRLGIPLLIGRDVIHGFQSIFPIPLGQAATWDPEQVRKGARISALEAARAGVNWTFAPMVDIGRDPRWGRVAECLGEDPYLSARLTTAMVQGFQGDDLADPGSIAACAKHFAGYGASESGRDYNTTNIPERELRDVHLPPFLAAVRAGVATLMTSFSDLDGIPASAHRQLLTDILRGEWGFEGFVVSDWESIPQLMDHGLAADRYESAREAANAGVDMDMAGYTYRDHLPALMEYGEVAREHVDAMVAAVLKVKLDLGLFDEPYTEPHRFPVFGDPAHLDAAREAARESMVLLENHDGCLPLEVGALERVAVIGPLADESAEQLGTWIFDGDPGLSVTPLQALREALSEEVDLRYVRALETTRDRSHDGIGEAVEAAREAQVAILFLGEDAILSGEAHCRTDITLPGAQSALLQAVHETGTPTVVVLMTGRPLALEKDLPHMDALLCAWHPGSMAGPAVVDLLFGEYSPSGRLPVTFPRVTGQIPIYYGHKNTGRPPTPDAWVHIDEIPPGVPQLSVGNRSFHLDTHYTPLFPFGFGLSYGAFEYRDMAVWHHGPGDEPTLADRLEVAAHVTNVGPRSAVEVVQLYLRDPVASATRPVRELKGFQRIELEPGQTEWVSFTLEADDLAFHGRDLRRTVEAGLFRFWIGGSSQAEMSAEVWVHDAPGD